jgi:hypothetical protein
MPKVTSARVWKVILVGRRLTDQMSDFDMRQLLVFEEALTRYQPLYGRAEARRRATGEIPLVFDMPTWQAAARSGDGLLPSYLAAALGGAAQRADWPSRRQLFDDQVRGRHLAEALARRDNAQGCQ